MYNYEKKLVHTKSYYKPDFKIGFKHFLNIFTKHNKIMSQGRLNVVS